VVLHRVALGEVYNLGTGVETRNIDMARGEYLEYYKAQYAGRLSQGV